MLRGAVLVTSVSVAPYRMKMRSTLPSSLSLLELLMLFMLNLSQLKRPLIMKFFKIFNATGSWDDNHISHSANDKADHLTKEGVSRSQPKLWIYVND
ncbi:Uncharacterized protein TCM_016123 [Theobroma cacao]|uniref:Uncharacterized protein n=1 Tax=Theobroma cacao TaxID=3641 RepID=A0A061G4Q4_THECC|nr:Uncharacterized protein TCM_016123 [Theobroma cacao]